LAVAQLVDHIHPALVGVGLPLALHVLHLDVGQFAILLFRQTGLSFDRGLFTIQLVPIPAFTAPAINSTAATCMTGPPRLPISKLGMPTAEPALLLPFGFGDPAD